MSEKKKTTRNTRKKQKKSLLMDITRIFSKFEVLFIVVLFLGFFVWAFSKCNHHNSPTTPPNTESDWSEDDDNYDDVSPASANTPRSPSYNLDEVNSSSNNSTGPPSSKINNGKVEVVNKANNNQFNSNGRRAYTPLYVTLQDLKVRTGPSRDSSIIAVLPLHEEVRFMEKRTGFRESINIGTETTKEPWIFIQTNKGHNGWVYGAGVHYFKWDRIKDPIPSTSTPEND